MSVYACDISTIVSVNVIDSTNANIVRLEIYVGGNLGTRLQKAAGKTLRTVNDTAHEISVSTAIHSEYVYMEVPLRTTTRPRYMKLDIDGSLLCTIKFELVCHMCDNNTAIIGSIVPLEMLASTE